MESSIQKLQSAISQNSYMLAGQHGRLPDGGRALRDTITQDKLRRTAGECQEEEAEHLQQEGGDNGPHPADLIEDITAGRRRR